MLARQVVKQSVKKSPDWRLERHCAELLAVLEDKIVSDHLTDVKIEKVLRRVFT